MLYTDKEILYISIHKYLNGQFYPGTGNLLNLGESQAEGFNLNFPLNPKEDQRIGDEEYIYIYERAIKPIVENYKPEFIYISSGLDCLEGDPLGGN